MLDTNVVVSAFLSPAGAPAQVVSAWERQAVELVVSEVLLQEYQRVLLYERVAIRHQMAPEDVAEIIE
ncbi:MAG: putative toxin-antitoxin system toxin component, PIN family, partial [Chloroflexi bacterium]|nr:putative toxin-antitoxin system toxin component, PIN family [Chloroflexota bacterium]